MANRRYIDFPIASSVGDSDIILIWQSGANKQTTKATFLSGLPENLDELNDVAISGLTNGQILRYDSVTGKWENTDQGNLDLNDLNDVSIVSPSNGQVLVYNSSTSKWENSSGGYVPYTGAVTTVNLGAQTIQAGSFVKAGGTAAQFLKADGSVDSNVYGTGTVTSVALTMPTAFSVANSPITTAGTLAVTGAGTVGQYIRGDGSLADFPESSGGGSSVSYYLNGSVAQGTIGGVAYKELNKVPVLGAGTDFTINADGYIASFITDAGDPNLLEIAAGNWNFETYFSASSNGGSPSFYVELYKVNSGGTATLIASNSTFPELIAFGTNVISYFSTLAVPTTALALTDRLAIRYYVIHSGRTITLHTEDNHLCQIITTFTTGITALNGLTAQVQNFAIGTSGTDFNIASATATHTFNLPTASATNRGALSSADWTTFNNKTSNLGTVTSVGLSSATSGVTIGSTPVTTSGTITLAIATASGSQNGLLSSTDWTTFNGKQNALTNPVTGTGTTNYLPKFTGSTTIGNSQVFDNGSVVSIGTNATLVQTLNINSTYASQSLNSNSGNFAYIGLLNGATGGGFNFAVEGSTGGTFGTGSTAYAGVLSRLGAYNLQFATDNVVRATINSSGNVGLGVTPSAWGAGYKVLQVGNASWYTDGNGFIQFASNTFQGASFIDRYIVTNFASKYEQVLGKHIWYTAPSGTAGNAITFTQPMTLTSGGNLLVGTTTDNGARLQVSGAAGGQLIRSQTTIAAGRNYLQWANGSGDMGYIGYGGADNKFYVSNQLNEDMIFATNNSERMRITSGGNVLIGTTTDSGARLQVTNTTSGDILKLTTSFASGRVLNFGFSDGSVLPTATFYIGNQTAVGVFIGEENTTNGLYVRSNGNVLIGTTTNGSSKLRLVGLPTSSAGLSSGDVYSLAGTLMIA